MCMKILSILNVVSAPVSQHVCVLRVIRLLAYFFFKFDRLFHAKSYMYKAVCVWSQFKGA